MQPNRANKVISKAKGIDAILLINTDTRDPNFTYLTGFKSGVYEGDMLLATKSSVKLITSPLEYDTAMSQKPDWLEIVNARSSKGKVHSMLKKELEGKAVGINGSFLPYSYFMQISKYKPKKVVDLSKAFSEARMIKDSDEIENIRRAASITKFAILEAQKSLKEGITEKEVAAKFNYAAQLFGADGLAFDTIVSFGKNAALPHHMPDSTRLTPGSFVLMDVGAKVNNYCADITRTIIFKEEKAEHLDKMKEMLSIVKNAQLTAIKKIKPGMKGNAIHRIAEQYINSAANGKYKGTFIHSLGHSVGIEVHDGQGFSPSATEILKPGMVITAEPGIYIEGFGGVRIEDDILVTDEGAVVL